MTVDYRVIEFKSSTPVREVGLFLRDPLTLDIRGEDFRNVAEVRINGIRSPEYVVVSPRRILAQVPRSQRSSPTGSVLVVTAEENLTSRALIEFMAVVPAGKVATGRVKLVQTFLRMLFTTPGSDIYAPKNGGGLMRVLGRADTPASLKASATLAVNRTQSQLVQIQAKEPRLDPSERLKSATLLSADFEPQTGTLSIRLRLTSVDGQTSDAGFLL